MTNIFAAAAELMSGGDDLTVYRDPESGEITRIVSHADGKESEYLRGMVELITEHLGLQQQDGYDKTVVYENILRRIQGAQVNDI